MSNRTCLFTSESVTAGHPDKVCDQISDAIVDACLKQDPYSRVAVETAVKNNNVFLLGELTSEASIDPESIAREVICDIGYDDPELGFCADDCSVFAHISQQSGDIAQGVSQKNEEIGAGDQGMMFGYADNQTKEFMPLPISLAHRLTRRLNFVRTCGLLPYLRPDGKAQVTVAYRDDKPLRVTSVVVSTQHNPAVSLAQLQTDIQKEVINHVIEEEKRSPNMDVHINPTGRFVVGGPVGDSGVTGRKIIVDTYGGWSRHGGGAFSGKDPTKVDRSAAYAARQAAKSVVAGGMASRCEIQLAYAIGVAKPVSVLVDTFDTNKVELENIEKYVADIDFRPKAIIERLGLRGPIYRATAAYGHFGRNDFAWERPLL